LGIREFTDYGIRGFGVAESRTLDFEIIILNLS